MTTRGFEWFVAWRHLRDPERRSRHAIALKVGLAIIVLAAGLLIYLKVHGTPMRDVNGFFTARPDPIYEWLRIGAVIGLIVGFVVTFLGSLLASFTVFTAFSVFGVFLGTAAPILALSVMSGFEADLKGKIRGAKADFAADARRTPGRDSRERAGHPARARGFGGYTVLGGGGHGALGGLAGGHLPAWHRSRHGCLGARSREDGA